MINNNLYFNNNIHMFTLHIYSKNTNQLLSFLLNTLHVLYNTILINLSPCLITLPLDCQLIPPTQ